MEENKTQNTIETPNNDDVEKNKVMAVLAYIIFFIPLLAAKDSKFAMYHAKQGLMLFILGVVVSLASTIIPFIGWFIISWAGSILVLVLAIMGIVNSAQGETKPLPLIGKLAIKWFKF